MDSPAELFDTAEEIGEICVERFGDEIWKSGASLMIAWAALMISANMTDAAAMRLLKSSMPETLRLIRDAHNSLATEGLH